MPKLRLLAQSFFCRETFETKPDGLANYKRADDSPPCDVCAENGMSHISAKVSCCQCNKLFCTNHLEVRNHSILFYPTTKPMFAVFKTNCCLKLEKS